MTSSMANSLMALEHLFVRLVARIAELLLADLLLDALDELDDLLVGLVARHDAVVHLLVGDDLVGARLDHGDALVRGRDGDSHIGSFHAAPRSGLMIYSPSIKPTDTPEIGPFHGMSEMVSAMEVPTMAAISGQAIVVHATSRCRRRRRRCACPSGTAGGSGGRSRGTSKSPYRSGGPPA